MAANFLLDLERSNCPFSKEHFPGDDECAENEEYVNFSMGIGTVLLVFPDDLPENRLASHG